MTTSSFAAADRYRHGSSALSITLAELAARAEALELEVNDTPEAG